MNITDKDGSVLMITLWAVIILMILAIGIKSHVDAHIIVAETLRERSQSLNLANSGVEYSIWQSLADTNEWDAATESWSQPGIWRQEAGVVTWQLSDESSRLNLNQASRLFMKALFSNVADIGADEADAIAAAVIDWRDEDDEPVPGGSEDVWVDGANSGISVPNTRLLSVYELQFLAGMDDALFSKLYPYVSVHGLGRVNINTASPEILLSLAESVSIENAGHGPGLVSKILSYRESGRSFRDIDWKQVSVDLGLNANETLLLRNMLDKLTVRTHYLRGRAESDFRETGSADTVVHYIFSKDSGQIVFWYEGKE